MIGISVLALYHYACIYAQICMYVPYVPINISYVYMYIYMYVYSEIDRLICMRRKAKVF